jgi:AcrR family transcriptional regulator
LSRAFIEMHRRRRYVDATAEILHEFGRAGATTTNVIQLAGGARNSFYELFRNVDDCIAYGVGLAETELFGHLADLTGADDWLAEVEQAIAGLYEAVAAQPVLAELFLVHPLVLDTDVGHSAFESGGERFVPLLGRGRAAAEDAGRRPPSARVEECLSRSIVALAAARVRSGSATLPAASRPTALLVASAYLGEDVAMERLDLATGAR